MANNWEKPWLEVQLIKRIRQINVLNLDEVNDIAVDYGVDILKVIDIYNQIKKQ